MTPRKSASAVRSAKRKSPKKSPAPSQAKPSIAAAVGSTKTAPAVSVSTHKDRSDWYSQRATFPLRDAPPAALERFLLQASLDTAPDHQWKRAGPFNVAGRVTSLVIHPDFPDTWFAGSAAGGVWISEDSGLSWAPCWSPFVCQNIGALAITRSGNEVWLVAATGEANLTADGYPGSGVYLCRDGRGITWEPMFNPPPGLVRLTPEEDVATFPRRFGSVVFDSNGRVALCSVTHDESMPAGLYLDDGGDGIQPVLAWGPHSYQCHSVLFHPKNPNLMYAAVEPRGSLNGIWRSKDAGKTWHQLTKGLPSGEQFGRTTLVFAPSNPRIIYALAASRSRKLLGVFRSRNGGNSWVNIAAEWIKTTTALEGANPNFENPAAQMTYNNTIAVHPKNPDILFWGGTHLLRTTNGGKTWDQVTTSSDRTLPNYVHPDHHQIIMPGGKHIYTANDGGVAISNDLGKTWQERSCGMVTTQFYSLAVAATDSRIIGGGAQDNGSHIAGVDGLTEGEFVRALPGDGGWMVIDPDDPQIVYGSAQHFTIYRHIPGRPYGFASANWKNVTPQNMEGGERRLRGFAVLALQPLATRGTKSKPALKPLWGGTTRLWRSLDGGDNWEPKSRILDGSYITAIAVSPISPKLLYAGTTNGAIYRSTDSGETWSPDLSTNIIPKRFITRIVIHPADPATVVLTIGSTGLRSVALRRISNKPQPPELNFGHVFRSGDFGATWQDLDRGQLPDVVYNAAAMETTPPHRLFVGGDTGVYVLQDGQWVNLNGNLPNVVVSDMDFHAKDRVLTVATYGRGIWRLPVSKNYKPPAAPGENDVQLTGYREDPKLAKPQLLTPAGGAVFNNFPRLTKASWRPVPGVVQYAVEIGIMVGSSWLSEFKGSRSTEATFEFGGAQNGRWRVFGLFPDNRRTPPSEWRTFRYTV